MPIKKTTKMPTNPAKKEAQATNLWDCAIADAEAKAQQFETNAKRLRAAIRLMRRQIADGVPFPDVQAS